MSTNSLRLLVACSVWLLAAPPALGHHFFPREADTSISIVGTVTRFELRNPHSRIVLEVRDATGIAATWTIEMGSLQNLVARGWEKGSVTPGDVITVEAVPHSGRANLAAARSVSLPDGRVMFAGSHVGDYPRR